MLYRLAEKAPAGSPLHGVGDTGIPFKEIAETIAGELGIETKSITAEEVPQYLGFLALFAGFDNPTSNDKTRQVLGWEPVHPDWVEDVRTGSLGSFSDPDGNGWRLQEITQRLPGRCACRPQARRGAMRGGGGE